MTAKMLLGNRRGQAAVEMALISLAFLFLFFGVIEFARALYTYNTIVHATRGAARWAVVNLPDADRVKNLVVYGNPDVSSGRPVSPGLTKAMVNVSYPALETGSNGVAINQKVSIRVTNYVFQFVVPIGGGITLPAVETSLYTESLGVINP